MQISQLVDVLLHLDQYLNLWIAQFGNGIYVILFMIIFCETGLLILPFLPGDSLLFALGALTVGENASLSFWPLSLLLVVAAILGDALNYTIGKYAGERVARSRWVKKEHLARTQAFYAKHGGKTIVLARFVPIVRTFAPFVAGVGHMPYRAFAAYNVFGGIFWIYSLMFAGRIFGNLPAVKRNFHLVIIAIILISFLPVVIEFWRAKRNSARSSVRAS